MSELNNMQRILKLSVVALPIMLILDMTWIGVVANNFYKTEYGALYSDHTVWSAVIIFYVMYILGLVYFVIAPAVQNNSLKQAAWRAAFFALVAYGTYDLTSLAITTNWPVLLTIVDMSWGVVCGVATSALTFVIAKRFFKA